MVCLSSFPCPTSSHFTLAFGSFCAPQPTEEVGYLVTKECPYLGGAGDAVGIPRVLRCGRLQDFRTVGIAVNITRVRALSSASHR